MIATLASRASPLTRVALVRFQRRHARVCHRRGPQQRRRRLPFYSGMGQERAGKAGPGLHFRCECFHLDLPESALTSLNVVSKPGRAIRQRI